MAITIGDELIVIKKMADVLKEGETVKVINVGENNIVTFLFGDEFQNRGMIDYTECKKYFSQCEN